MKKLMLAAVALSVLVSSGAAMADPQPYRSHPDRQEQPGPDGRRDDRGPDARRDDRGRPQGNRHERRAERRYNGGVYRQPRGWRAHQWRHGERLPSYYRSQAYVLDHRRYGLRAPPPGYYYVRVNRDVVLVRRDNGLIASVIMLLFR